MDRSSVERHNHDSLSSQQKILHCANGCVSSRLSFIATTCYEWICDFFLVHTRWVPIWPMEACDLRIWTSCSNLGRKGGYVITWLTCQPICSRFFGRRYAILSRPDLASYHGRLLLWVAGNGYDRQLSGLSYCG